MPELRLNLGYGYLKHTIPSKQAAIKLLVRLRGSNSGFYYNQNDPDNCIILAKTLQGYNEIVKVLAS
jgi:hypothetical protein